MAGSVYEAWVDGLRRWGRDPKTDLSVLPALTAESLPPQAYARLFAHVNTAIQTMMSDFGDQFSRGLDAARSDHDMATVIVGLRAHLARRIQLAAHPGLPEEIRKPLYDSASRDIHALQADLERIVGSGSNRAGSDRAQAERMLKLVRDNSFVAILRPGFPLGSLVTGRQGMTPPAQQRAEPAPLPTHTGPIRRRVFLADESSAPPR